MKPTRPLDAAGRAALMRDFEAIPARMKAAARKEIHVAADRMVQQMKASVPVDSGDLKESIRKEDVSTPTWIRVRVEVGGEKTTRQIGTRTYDREVSLGSGDTAGRKKTRGGKGVTYDYARAIEFGTEHQGPQPFFRPVSAREGKAGKSRLNRALKKAAEED